jgi:outer membrane immunogenic protein
MRKLLLAALAFAAMVAGPATAADMATPAYKVPPIPLFSWTGCYLGINGGGGRSTNDWGNLLGLVVNGNVRGSGFFGGGQVGCDYQIGTWVLGIEGQFDWSDLHGQTLVPPQGVPAQDVTKLDRFATATGRIGYAFDRVLTYVKSGLAWAHYNHEFDVQAAGAGTAFTPAFIGTQGVVGFVVGSGFEVAFLPNWSFKVEYNYFDFGTNGAQFSCAAPCGATPQPFPIDIKQNVQTVLFGMNYRFGPGAVIAKY